MILHGEFNVHGNAATIYQLFFEGARQEGMCKQGYWLRRREGTQSPRPHFVMSLLVLCFIGSPFSTCTLSFGTHDSWSLYTTCARRFRRHVRHLRHCVNG